MNGYHISTILGTVIKDPTPICTLKTGTEPIGADLTLAINSSHLVKGKWQEQTCYVTCTAWYALAKRVLDSKWCRKGYHVILTAKTTENTYTDNNGNTKRRPDHKILDIQPVLLSPASKSAPKDTPTPAPADPAPAQPAEADEDIPF